MSTAPWRERHADFKASLLDPEARCRYAARVNAKLIGSGENLEASTWREKLVGAFAVLSLVRVLAFAQGAAR